MSTPVFKTGALSHSAILPEKTDPASDSNAGPSVRADNRDAGSVKRIPPPVIGIDGIQPCVYRLLAEGKFVQSLLLSRVSMCELSPMEVR